MFGAISHSPINNQELSFKNLGIKIDIKKSINHLHPKLKTFFLPIPLLSHNIWSTYIRLVKNILFSDFENTVNANREAAERALIEVDRINEIIQQAKEKTDQAREAMTGADTSAQLALNVALEGEKIVKESSEKASIIKEKAVESQKYAFFF